MVNDENCTLTFSKYWEFRSQLIFCRVPLAWDFIANNAQETITINIKHFLHLHSKEKHLIYQMGGVCMPVERVVVRQLFRAVLALDGLGLQGSVVRVFLVAAQNLLVRVVVLARRTHHPVWRRELILDVKKIYCLSQFRKSEGKCLAEKSLISTGTRNKAVVAKILAYLIKDVFALQVY